VKQVTALKAAIAKREKGLQPFVLCSVSVFSGFFDVSLG
jgi:hypothetical protein